MLADQQNQHTRRRTSKKLKTAQWRRIHESFFRTTPSTVEMIVTDGFNSPTLGPIWRASFALKFNDVSGVFIIWVSDSGASTMLVGLPAREDTVKE